MGALLTLGPKLSELYNFAVKTCAYWRSVKYTPTPEALADAILNEYRAWDPVISGRKVLADPETRRAAARFVAGVVLALE